MISLLKKTVIGFIIVTALFFIVGEMLLIDKGEAAPLSALKSSPIKILENAFAKKQPVKEQPVQKQPKQQQPVKGQPVTKQPEKQQSVTEQPVKQQPVQEQPANQQPTLAQSKILDVPLINQQDAPGLYNGCEVTSLAMILNYNGYNVTKNELANNIATVPLTYQNGLKGNPNDGFVGNMQYGPGYAVYNGPIYDLAKKYAGTKAVNLTNSSFTDLLMRVSQGEPVWIITTETFAPVSDFQEWNTPEGTIKISFSEHSVVITGYDDNYIYINNPYGQKNEQLNRNSFEQAWEQMGNQAVVIEK